MQMNIYIPESLRKQMEYIPGVIWSRVACAAFSHEVARHQAMQHTHKERCEHCGSTVHKPLLDYAI